MVNQKAQQAVQQSLDTVTGDAKTGVPGLVFVAVDKSGQEIVAAASGRIGLESKKDMTLDTVFWIASCTKLLATIACIQAVEEGKLDLDDSELLYKHCPELREVKVLQDDGSLVEKEKEITLRMLLTHTAGFGYEFFNQKLRDYGRPIGFDAFAGNDDVLRMPLVNQPGSRFEYGINIDWAGVALERATGVRLNDWVVSRIAEPLGLKNINFFPTPEMKANLAYMHQRWPGNAEHCEQRDHIYRAALVAETKERQAQVFNSGGAGAFATPRDYVQVLATLLNEGRSPTSGTQILKPESVQEMFRNQIPEHPDFARTSIAAAKADQTNAIPELYPQEGNPPQGWGLSFMITQDPGATGRAANTGWWAGIANLFYWVDREKGVAGMIASQIMPFGDAHVMGQWGACEHAVYSAL